MTEQPGCSTASMQTPLHIDLPPVDQDNVSFIISKCLIQLPIQQWDFLYSGLLTYDVVTGLAFSCMDIIQTFAEAILDCAIPKAYRYMRTNEAFYSTIVTEDQIHAYLEDSVGQALTKCMKIDVQNLVSTKSFTELLVRHITRTVNSVLTLSTSAPILESRIPVLFVSGCVTSIRDLTDMAFQMAVILMAAIDAQKPPEELTGAQLSTTTLPEPGMEVEPPILFSNFNHDLVKQLRNYIIHMVKVLKGGVQKPLCEINFSNYQDVYIRVGMNTRILTVENSETHGQEASMPSCGGWDAIPGVVPYSDEPKSHPKSPPFFSAPVISITGCFNQIDPMKELDIIKKIADELVQEFLEEQQGAEETYDLQKAASDGLEDVDKVKMREFTDRIFNVIMSGVDYQIPLVPARTRVCDSVTYRQLRRSDIGAPGAVARILYMKTEEVVARCVSQVLLWSALKSKRSGHFFPGPSLQDLLFQPDLLLTIDAIGEHVAVPLRISSQASDDTYDLVSESQASTHSDMLLRCTVMTWLIQHMLTKKGIEITEIVSEAIKKACEHISNEALEASLLNKNCEDITETLFADLLLEFGSVSEMRRATAAGDPSFEEAIVSTLRKQLGIPILASPHENAAKKTTCGFIKKFKRLCCKKTSKKTSETTAVIDLTSDQDDYELPDDDSLREETQRCWCPCMCRIPAFIRKTCSSQKRTFSSITSAMGRPFITCFCPESE
ncbi:uncharacterized protein LOC130187854 [Seriola aureovittata]|uniref:uncharacterized protein LOC130187854 n=1 Tax=Seriola aureovittata TaxID=2871759 RepID=UPI0024BD6459|nr:uncharacterized protein LOC130187854 [Seriola aureovittata]